MEFFPEQTNEEDLRLSAVNNLRSESHKELDSGSEALLRFENDFNTFDKDDNGFLSFDELELVENDKKNDENLRRVAGLLKRDIESVEEFSNDEWFDENDGITASDLHLLRSSNQSIPQPGFSNWFRDSFSAFNGSYEIGIVPMPDPISWGEKQVPTRVLHVYRGSAAEYAGLQSNDLIKKIDGQDITEMKPREVEALLRGEKGSKVTLEIKRGWRTKSITIQRKKQVSVDSLSTNFGSRELGSSKAKDADSNQLCRPNREYTSIIKKAAYEHYNPFSLGDLRELNHKYNCVINDPEEAHKKAQQEIRSLTGDSYTEIIDKKEVEKPEAAEEDSKKEEDIEEKDLGNGIAYIRLTDFREESDSEKMADAIKKHEQAEAFVIDLRGNPGGLMDVAIDVTSMLIPKGEILRTYQRSSSDPANPKYFSKDYSLSDRHLKTRSTYQNGSVRINTERRQPYLLDGRPLVVLVDRSSASASEIVAGAVKDNDAATLVGTKTFGKGKGQTTYGINSQHSIKMTTFRFTSPDGIWPGDARTKKYGIKPDVNVYGGSWVKKGSDADQQLKKGVEILNEKLGRTGDQD